MRKRRIITERKKVDKARKGNADTNAPSLAKVVDLESLGENPQVYVRRNSPKNNVSPVERMKAIEKEVQDEEAPTNDMEKRAATRNNFPIPSPHHNVHILEEVVHQEGNISNDPEQLEEEDDEVSTPESGEWRRFVQEMKQSTSRLES